MGALLLVVATAEVTTLRPPDLRTRLRLLDQSARLPSSISRLHAVGFLFDPNFAPFLEAVRRLTPPDATVAVVAPKTSELYVYQAAYTLAPRRVVSEGQVREASSVALYAEQSVSGLSAGTPIPNGLLVQR